MNGFSRLSVKRLTSAGWGDEMQDVAHHRLRAAAAGPTQPPPPAGQQLSAAYGPGSPWGQSCSSRMLSSYVLPPHAEMWTDGAKAASGPWHQCCMRVTLRCQELTVKKAESTWTVLDEAVTAVLTHSRPPGTRLPSSVDGQAKQSTGCLQVSPCAAASLWGELAAPSLKHPLPLKERRTTWLPRPRKTFSQKRVKWTCHCRKCITAVNDKIWALKQD